MTDTPAPNEMPDVYYEPVNGRKPKTDEKVVLCFERLRAPVAAGGEEIDKLLDILIDVCKNSQAETGLASCIVPQYRLEQIRSALQQPPAPAVDLEALIRDTALVAQNIDDGSGPHKQDVEWVIRHLAAQGMIKGRG